MAAALRRIEHRIGVEYSQFYLLDHAITDLPTPRWNPPQWVQAGENWVAFLSGGQDHYASVQLQAWDREPPPTQQAWDLITDVSFLARSGTVRLWALTMGPSGDELQLGPPGRYHLRAHCRGREAVRRALDDITAPAATLPVDIEAYLVQLWPTQATDGAPTPQQAGRRPA
jgi:hypothetical protein